MNLEEKILKRIEELKQIREQAVERLNQQAANVLAPVDTVIAELTSLLQEGDGKENS